MTEEVKCYLYWIHTEDHTDMFSEGYIGVSRNPEWRFYQHLRNAVNPKEYKNYRTAFREAMANDKAIYEIMVCASSAYCYELEGKLRPTWKIGWNIAAGGSGGVGKHGLSGTNVKRAYYNMLTRSRETNATVCDEWTCKDMGLINFQKFYESIDEGLQISTAGLTHISPETVQLLTRTEIVGNAKRKYELYGEIYTIKELAEMFGIKPNTLSWRIKRGATLKQALRLDESDE